MDQDCSLIFEMYQRITSKPNIILEQDQPLQMYTNIDFTKIQQIDLAIKSGGDPFARTIPDQSYEVANVVQDKGMYIVNGVNVQNQQLLVTFSSNGITVRPQQGEEFTISVDFLKNSVLYDRVDNSLTLIKMELLD